MNTDELRPLGMGELLTGTFNLYLKRFRLFVGIAIFPALVGFVMLLALEQSIGLALLLFLALVAISSWSAAATVLAVAETHLGRPASIGQAYSRTKKKVSRMVGVALVYAGEVMLGLLLFVVPGILVLLRNAVAIPAAVAEPLSVNGALTRSWLLIKGNVGRIFLVFVLFWGVSWLAIFIFQLPFAAVQGGLVVSGREVPFWVTISNHLATAAVTVLVGPLFMIALSLVYFDLRVRKEGFNLNTMKKLVEQI